MYGYCGVSYRDSHPHLLSRLGLRLTQSFMWPERSSIRYINTSQNQAVMCKPHFASYIAKYEQLSFHTSLLTLSLSSLLTLTLSLSSLPFPFSVSLHPSLPQSPLPPFALSLLHLPPSLHPSLPPSLPPILPVLCDDSVHWTIALS